MTEATKIIEINGVKFEVDARTATLRQIDTIRVGARVKVLKKKYNDDYEVHHGVVVGFEPFKDAPTIIIAYIETSYGSAPAIKFLYFHAKSQEQIIISDENDKESLIASDITGQIDREIVKKKQEIQDLEDRRAYFLRSFQSYWNPMTMPSPDGDNKVVQ
jgi:hypothetical protein